VSSIERSMSWRMARRRGRQRSPRTFGPDFAYDAFLPGAHTAQVDHDAAHLGRRTPLQVAVHGDVGETLRALDGLLEPKASRRFLDDMLRRHERALIRVVGPTPRGASNARRST
jgi:pyruvate dehydrogenase (quinone)